MNILVTGSKGFVGKNLMERLKDREVRTFNRNDLLSCENIDVVIHLAAFTHSRRSDEKIFDAVQGNIGLFVRVLEEAVKQKVRRFIYVSSIEAEEGKNIYAISKRTCEQILERISEVSGMEYVILRPCNLYGPHMDLSDPTRNVIANFLKAIKEKKRLPIQNGESSYPFTYVGVLIDAIIDSLEHNTNQTVRIGSNHYISLYDMASYLEGITKTWDWMKYES